MEKAKAIHFIERLWTNPSLSGLSPLQKEEQLCQFLEVHADALTPALTSADFFPGYPWNQIKALLIETLQESTEEVFAKYIENILSTLNLSFIHKLDGSRKPLPSVQLQVNEYLHQLFREPCSRKELIGPLVGIETGLVDKYVAEVLRIQRYITLEIFKIERVNIDEDQVADMLKVIMLLRAMVLYQASVHHLVSETSTSLHISTKFAQKIQEETSRKLNLLPEYLIKAATNSYLVFQESPEMGAMASMAAIFSRRCRNLNPQIQHVRGAETSDTSWFSVARKNYKYFGFDLSMLTELHFIATSNRW